MDRPKGEANRDELKKRWGEVYDRLQQLGELHVWPGEKDIRRLEKELNRELDLIERKLRQL